MRDDDLRRALAARVRSLIAARASATPEELDSLALEIFAFQRRTSAPYRAWLDLHGVDPRQVRRATQIPALPQSAWKRLEVRSFPAEQPLAARFESSGTTSSARSIQALPSTDLYDASLEATLGDALVPPDRVCEFHALVAPAEAAPSSSLVYMIDRAARVFSGAPAATYIDGDTLAVARLTHALGRAQRPVILLGTAFAFVHLLDALDGRTVPLPPGSRVMETGGFKGRSRSVEPTVLHAALATTFAVDVGAVCNQYGMCETSTQLYDSLDDAGVRAKPIPPWMAVTIVDPRTLAPRPPATRGLIKLFDAANLYTCAAILTADLGTLLPDGRLVVHGRAASADRRGCSLVAEDLRLPVAARGAGA